MFFDNLALIRLYLNLEVLSLIEELKSTPPSPPLTPSGVLEKAALDHVQDHEDNEIVGSKGSDGSGVYARIQRYGPVTGLMGENIKYGKDSPLEIVMAWLIDDADPHSGRRHNMLNPG